MDKFGAPLWQYGRIRNLARELPKGTQLTPSQFAALASLQHRQAAANLKYFASKRPQEIKRIKQGRAGSLHGKVLQEAVYEIQ